MEEKKTDQDKTVIQMEEGPEAWKAVLSARAVLIKGGDFPLVWLQRMPYPEEVQALLPAIVTAGETKHFDHQGKELASDLPMCIHDAASYLLAAIETADEGRNGPAFEEVFPDIAEDLSELVEQSCSDCSDADAASIEFIGRERPLYERRGRSRKVKLDNRSYDTVEGARSAARSLANKYQFPIDIFQDGDVFFLVKGSSRTPGMLAASNAAEERKLMGEAKRRKQRGIYPTQTFELEPEESERLSNMLPPYIIGMEFDKDGLEAFQIDLNTVCYGEPGYISIADLGRMPFLGHCPEPETVKEIWITNVSDEDHELDDTCLESWSIRLKLNNGQEIIGPAISLRFVGDSFETGGFVVDLIDDGIIFQSGESVLPLSPESVSFSNLNTVEIEGIGSIPFDGVLPPIANLVKVWLVQDRQGNRSLRFVARRNTSATNQQ